ncbi:MAG TPA: hypothetical protein VK302_12710 [Terriglobales bacterium]|nr:hypothetical protein [Terriglobales bacterium]
MLRRLPLFLIVCICASRLHAQSLADIEIHGFVTQGFLFCSHSNYLTMQSSVGSLAWTDGAVSVSDSLTDKLRVGIQLHMYQLGQLGGPNIQVDWASGDYRVNDHLGFRAGKVKTVMGLFNDSQDVDSIFLWILLPQAIYSIDNKSFFLSHVGGEVYGGVPLSRRAGKLEYRGYAGYAALDLNGGYVKQAADSGVVFTSAPGGKIFGGDVRWQSPLVGLTVGASARVQALDGTAPGVSVHVTPTFISTEYAQVEKRKFYFAGEYRRFPLYTTVAIGPEVIPVPQDARSWYAMGSYRLRKKFQVGSYYSHYVNKALNTSLPANYSKDWVVSGRYDFNSYFYAKIEGHFLHGDGLGYYASTNPDGLKSNSNMLAAKIGFSF